MNVSPEPLWPWVRVVALTLFHTRVALLVRLHLPHVYCKYVSCHKPRGYDLQLARMLIQKLLVPRCRVLHQAITGTAERGSRRSGALASILYFVAKSSTMKTGEFNEADPFLAACVWS